MENLFRYFRQCFSQNAIPYLLIAYIVLIPQFSCTTVKEIQGKELHFNNKYMDKAASIFFNHLYSRLTGFELTDSFVIQESKCMYVKNSKNHRKGLEKYRVKGRDLKYLKVDIKNNDLNNYDLGNIDMQFTDKTYEQLESNTVNSNCFYFVISSPFEYDNNKYVTIGMRNLSNGVEIVNFVVEFVDGDINNCNYANQFLII